MISLGVPGVLGVVSVAAAAYVKIKGKTGRSLELRYSGSNHAIVINEYTLNRRAHFESVELPWI